MNGFPRINRRHTPTEQDRLALALQLAWGNEVRAARIARTALLDVALLGRVLLYPRKKERNHGLIG